MNQPTRILLIRLSAVGDVINTLPALQAIRAAHRGAFIGFAVEDRAHDLVAGHPAVDRVHLYPRKRWSRMLRRPWQWPRLMGEVRGFVRELRSAAYDTVLDFQGNLKGAAHALASGASSRVGFSRGHCNEANHLFSNIHVTPPRNGVINRVEKFLSLAAAVGASPADAAYRLPPAPDSAARVDGFLSSAGLGSYGVIHPGTSAFGSIKRWAPDRFAALAARIASERDLRCVITWGPAERPLAEEIVGGSNGGAVLGPETPCILDLAEIIHRARFFLGSDTGPLHLASAVGTPSVALFGPKDPAIYGPYNPVRRVVSKPDGSMDAITVDDAFRAVAEVLLETTNR